MRNFSLNRNEGFTILEVVFAVSILAIGIMGYTALKTASRYSMVYSKNLNQAILLTGTKLEELLMRGYYADEMDAVTNGGVHDFTSADYIGEYGYALQSGDFAADGVHWTVREKCPSELTKLVDYTIRWGSKNLTIAQVQVRP